MGKIAVLPPDLASQIAAGEVVERPGSAVKELIENSLDAGATRVDVSIAGGGITHIAVLDDGEGMSPSDAERALERHATSKLAKLADLERVATFGFRGEALPSIASVSRFALATRSADADEGTEVRVEGGGRAQVRPCGMPRGTRIEVRDLFFNVPARRKFLRSANTESGHVADVLEGAALARPDVTFTLERDGRRAREWLRVADREARVRDVLEGEDLARCEGERGPLRVLALLGRPERARAGAAGLRLLVNGRPIRDRALALTIAQSYGSVLERGRYPRGVVYLDLPPELVDVNVHPQKSEVRFADPRAMNDAVYGLLSRQLASAFSLPTPSRTQWSAKAGAAPSAARVSVDHRGEASLPFRRASGAPEPPRASEGGATQVRAPDARRIVAEANDPRGTEGRSSHEHDPDASASPPVAIAPRSADPLMVADAAAPIRPRPDTPWASLRFVAQVRHTYLLCETDEGLYVLDQHAAAERVAFDRLSKQYRARSVPSQALLFPINFEVTPLEAELCERRAEEMSGVGLEIRVRGSGTISVHAVPRLLAKASPERLVRDLLAEVSRSGGRGFSDAIDLALATMACHGALRAGDPVSADEARALLLALDGADFAGHCPHGRPVVTFTSWHELERKVGRR